LESVFGGLTTHVSGLSQLWSGEGFDSFSREYEALRTAVSTGADEIRSLASSLDGLADQISEAQHRYDAALIAVGVTAVAGIGLTILTAGVSDEVALVAVEGEVGAAVAIAETATLSATALLQSAAAVARSLATRFLVNFGVSLGAQMVGDVIAFPDHNPFSHLDFANALITAGGLTALGAIAPALARLPALQSLPRGLANVGAMSAAGAGVDAASQQLTTGHIDPIQVLFTGGLAGLLAAAPGLSERPTMVKVNGYSFVLDSSGRVLEATGSLYLQPGETVQAAMARTVREAGLPTDHAGHLIARRFNGPAELYNLIPQDALLNNRAWKAMENEWASALSNGQKVEVNIRLTRPPGLDRPTEFNVKYSIDGTVYRKIIPNSPPPPLPNP